MNSNLAAPNYSLWRTLGLLGLLGAIMVGIGEFMVHYNPAGFEGESFAFFGGVTDSSLAIGHFMMIAFMPFYVFGYLHLYLGLRPGGVKIASAVFALGVFAFMVGGVWVGSRAFMGSLQHLLDTPETLALWNEVVIRYNFFLENLVQALRIFILALSACFIVAIVRGGTIYPRWYAICAPIIPLILIFVSFFVIPSVGKYLVPAAMNVAHVLVFSLSLFSGSTRLRQLTNT
jgi:hypothetical protein